MTEPHESRVARALLVLTAATGLIDAVSYLALGHVFTANMTGNVVFLAFAVAGAPAKARDRKSTRLNSSHLVISYAVFCLKKKKKTPERGGPPAPPRGTEETGRRNLSS